MSILEACPHVASVADSSVSEPPRVLFIDHTAELGGGEIALLNLVTHLDTRRCKPIVMLFSDGPLRPLLEERGIETVLLPLPESIVRARKDGLGASSLLRLKDVFASMRFCIRLARWMRSNNVLLVHTNSLKADLLGGIAGRLAMVPVIWHVRDRISADYLPSKIVTMFRLAARVIPKVVIANSRATLQTLTDATDEDSRRWRVVHDGTPWIESTEPRATEPNATPSPLVVGIVGRISSWKGQHVFLRAAAIIRRQFPRVRFRIIGSAMFNEAEYERSLHVLCDELELRECVEFTGFQKDVVAAIRDLDVLVHASTIGEPFGQVVIEAMVNAKPVIATRGGGVPEIVTDTVTGLLVPMNDAQAMADALTKLLDNSHLRDAMGHAGRERVAKHFRIEHVAANVTRLYSVVNPSFESK